MKADIVGSDDDEIVVSSFRWLLLPLREAGDEEKDVRASRR
jgi:hypothetical protein